MQNSAQLHTAGRISGAGAVLASAQGTAGFTVVRNGAGDYTITLGEAIDLLERVTTLVGKSSTFVMNVVAETDTTLQVINFASTTGAAADGEFQFAIFRIAG